jgi:uncharacterized membrane protein YcaP (DUF421 family)
MVLQGEKMSSEMLFQSWASLGRTIVVGGLGYAALVMMLRISGKRTLAKMNSFDLIVTVALGSTLASMLLTKNVALADGIVAFALLILLQFLITWLSVRTKAVRKLARATPQLLLYHGQLLDGPMRAERVTESEVLQAVRSQGMLSLSEVVAVVLETDGTFSVIQGAAEANHSSLAGVAADGRRPRSG